MTDAAVLANLADIELPAAPEWNPLTLLLPLLLAITVIVVIAGLYLARRRGQAHISTTTPLSLRQQALVRLDDLQQAWRAGTIDDRETGYRLGTLLRRGLALNRLEATPPAAVDDRPADWRRLVEHLEAIRYHPQYPPLTAAIFDQARAWLTREEDTGAAHHA